MHWAMARQMERHWPDERTASVNVDWKIVQECRRRGHKIRGLKEHKKEHQRKRPAGRGGSVKGGP